MHNRKTNIYTERKKKMTTTTEKYQAGRTISLFNRKCLIGTRNSSTTLLVHELKITVGNCFYILSKPSTWGIRGKERTAPSSDDSRTHSLLRQGRCTGQAREGALLYLFCVHLTPAGYDVASDRCVAPPLQRHRQHWPMPLQRD